MIVISQMKNVLFVCFGNICRSPACEGIARYMFPDKANYDSAGTSAWEGSTPDKRSVSVCKKHGIDISHHCGKQIDETDFSNFDLIVALDSDVLETLENMKPENAKAKLVLFDEKNGGVTDPWYGDESGFDDMYNQIVNVMPSFLKEHGIAS
ncbi:Low molecular weight phosphotyrosine protein phosphatase [Tritrichomonas musculus]|uniref:Low molecular weight phosphotyrosine protein phosphatase n=1 Tax=Tritrichomonas musculus TaxID=1915356 RepID=A0ABR2H3Q9_9EUKA